MSEEHENFIRMIKEKAPDTLTGEHVVRIAGFLITAYATSPKDAAMWLNVLAQGLSHYYSSDDETIH